MNIRISVISVALLATIYIAGCGRAGVLEDPIIEDLGTLGGDGSFANGINNFGSVTGASFLAGSPVVTHAFRYVDGQGMVDVGTPVPGAQSIGMKINNGGLICGGYVDVNGFNGAFIASAALNLTSLDGPHINDAWAWDVNDRGQIIGETSEGFSPPRATLWTSATERQDLGTLGGTFSVGRGINETGQVAGYSGTRNDTTSLAFRYTSSVGMVSLGTLGGPSSHGYGINDTGRVVGESDTVELHHGKRSAPGITTDRTVHAFLWTEGVGMADLGALSGNSSIFGRGNSTAMAINNNSVVVGFSTLGPMEGGTKHAFRWTKEEGMIDLNTLLPIGSGWVLTEAIDINDKGAITGTGLHNGKRRAFRMFHHPVGVVKA